MNGAVKDEQKFPEVESCITDRQLTRYGWKEFWPKLKPFVARRQL